MKMRWTVFGIVLLAGLAWGQVTFKSQHYDIIAPDGERKIAELRQKQLEWSAWVFEDLFAVPPSRGQVTLDKEPAAARKMDSEDGMRGAAVITTEFYDKQGNVYRNEPWKLSWFLEDPFRTDEKGSSIDRESTALTHEAAHLQLARLVNPKATEEMKENFNGYGGFVPDWLDEAVAVYHEPEFMKLRRRKNMKKLAEKEKEIIPLKKLFTMSHPLVVDDLTQGLKVKISYPEGKPPTAEELEKLKKEAMAKAAKRMAERKKADPKQVHAFYVQSLSVLEFMADRGGKPFVRYVADEQAAGKTMDQVLQGWRTKHEEIIRLRRGAEAKARRSRKSVGQPNPSLPPLAKAVVVAGVRIRPLEKVRPMAATVETLQRDWLWWVEHRYPQHKPNHPPFPKK